MSDKKTKVGFNLVTRGTAEANAQAVDDLAIPDPEPAIGKRLIDEAMRKDTEDDGQPKDS